jgi:hypothetical protein
MDEEHYEESQHANCPVTAQQAAQISNLSAIISRHMLEAEPYCSSSWSVIGVAEQLHSNRSCNCIKQRVLLGMVSMSSEACLTCHKVLAAMRAEIFMLSCCQQPQAKLHGGSTRHRLLCQDC